uniref:Kinesin motor protein-related n=1 Tax=Arundo donax TaxID=35708 RepID=A0A0A9LBC9_ARUDO
MVCVTATSRW